MSKTTYSMKELGQLADPSFTQVWVMPEVDRRRRRAEKEAMEATRQRVITANARAATLSQSAGLAFTRSSRNVFGRPRSSPGGGGGGGGSTRSGGGVSARSGGSTGTGSTVSGVTGMWAHGWARGSGVWKGPSPKNKRRAGSHRPLTPTWRLPTGATRAQAAKASMLPGRRGRRGSMSVRLRKKPAVADANKASSTRHLGTPASTASGGEDGDRWWKRAIVRPAPVLSAVGGGAAPASAPEDGDGAGVTLEDVKRVHMRDWGAYKLNGTTANAKYPRVCSPVLPPPALCPSHPRIAAASPVPRVRAWSQRLRSPFMKERPASGAPREHHPGTNRLAEGQSWARPSSAPAAARARSPEHATMNKIRSIQLASIGR